LGCDCLTTKRRICARHHEELTRRLDSVRVLDGPLFARMVRSANQELRRHREEINAQNVFPVPDGDTGTNMSLSLEAGVRQLAALRPGEPLRAVAAALCSGLLMGARGNSGVILSQLFRGFQAVFTSDTATAEMCAKALLAGVDVAYRAVSKPVEGTILSVARAAAEAASDGARQGSVEAVFAAALAAARDALRRTPAQLQVLHQAGVVDSGGSGLVAVYEGFLSALREGDEADLAESETCFIAPDVLTPDRAIGVWDAGEFGYCTEFIVRSEQTEQEWVDAVAASLRSDLAHFGDSIVIATAAPLIKAHVHTLHPGKALERALEVGPLVRVKIDNMTEQSHALLFTGADEAATPADAATSDSAATPSDAATSDSAATPSDASTPSNAASAPIASALTVVCPGEKFRDLLRSVAAPAVHCVLENEAERSETWISLFAGLGQSDIIVCPGREDVGQLVQHAAATVQRAVSVLPPGGMGMALAAALAFDPTLDGAANRERMRAAVTCVSEGCVRASSDSHSAAWAATVGGQTLAEESSPAAALRLLLSELCAPERSLCTVFCATDELRREADQVIGCLQEQWPHVQIELHVAGQSDVPFAVAVE